MTTVPHRELTPGQIDLGSTLAELPAPRSGPRLFWAELVRRFEGTPDDVLHLVAAEIDEQCRPEPRHILDRPVTRPQPSAARIERMISVAMLATAELDRFLASRSTPRFRRRR